MEVIFQNMIHQHSMRHIQHVRMLWFNILHMSIRWHINQCPNINEYTIWLFNSSPWKITIFKNGKPW